MTYTHIRIMYLHNIQSTIDIFPDFLGDSGKIAYVLNKNIDNFW